jgi:two-component system, NarL family, response regulator LiaR
MEGFPAKRNTMIRIIICDDQELVCEGLKAIIGTDPGLAVTGVAHDGQECVEMVDTLVPDLVLMDLKMPIMNGVQATGMIHRLLPSVKVLVLTTYDADQWVFDAIRAGAAGYLLKDTPRENLLAAIKDTVEGKTPVDSAVAGKLFARITNQSPLPESNAFEQLNDREKEVLGLLARGLSNADIARKIFLSEGTVKNYVSSIFEKLGVNDRTQAAIYAIQYGLAGHSKK